MDQQWQQDTMGKKKTWKLKKEIEALCSLKVEQSYCLFSASTSFSLLPLFPPFVLPPQISFSALWFWLSSFYHTHSSPTSHFISFSFLLSVSGSLNVSSDVCLAYFSPLITLFPSFYSLCQSSHLLCPPSNTHTHALFSLHFGLFSTLHYSDVHRFLLSLPSQTGVYFRRPMGSE